MTTPNFKAAAGKTMRPAIKAVRANRLIWRGLRVVSPKLRGRLEAAAADCMLVSFPKCGRTWLRFMLGEAFCRHFGVVLDDVTALTHHSMKRPGAPCIQVTHDLDPHLCTPDEITFTPGPYGGKKIIFLVRDPRDVLVSLFFQATQRRQYDKPGLPKPERAGDLIDQHRGGLESLIRFYNVWGEACAARSDSLTVRYEDMRRDPAAELRRVLAFLGVRIADDIIAEAVAAGDFDNMRAIEAKGQDATGRLKPGDPGNKDSYKVRRGVVGGYRDYLSADEVKAMDSVIEAQLSDVFSDYKRPSPAPEPA